MSIQRIENTNEQELSSHFRGRVNNEQVRNKTNEDVHEEKKRYMKGENGWFNPGVFTSFCRLLFLLQFSHSKKQ